MIRTRRRWTTVAVVAVVAVGVIMVTASPAQAAPVAADSYTDLTDTAGNSIDDYKLSLDGGSAWNINDTKKFWKPLIELIWGIYRLNVSLQISMLDKLLEASWTTALIAPLRGMTSGITKILDTIGLESLMLTLLGFSVAILAVKGRSGTAVVALMIGCLVYALGATYLADPSDLVSKDGGYITQAQDAGDDIVAELFPNESTDTLASSLVDTLIRGPHQFINYGGSLDGTDCEETYNETLGKDEAWKKVGDCNDSYKAAAQDVGADKLAFLLVGLMPVQLGFGSFSSAIVILFAIFVIGAAWQAVTLTWSQVTGIVAGGGRRSFVRALMMLAVALSAIAVTQAAVVIWMKIVDIAFSSEIDVSLPLRFMFASALFQFGPVAMGLMYLRARKSAKAVADKMASLGAGTEGSQPLNIGQAAMRTASIAKDLAMLAAMRKKSTPPEPPEKPVKVDSTLKPVNTENPAPTSFKTELPQRPERRQITSGNNGSSPTSSPGSPSGGPRPHRQDEQPVSTAPEDADTRKAAKRSKIVSAVMTAGKVGLAAATGGMSAAASAVGRVALSSAVSRGLASMGRNKPTTGTTRPTNNPRETALREKLQAAKSRPVNYTNQHGRLVDGETGQSFTRARVGNTEILTPAPATTNARSKT